MANDARGGLARRERQVMEALFRLGRASAAEVREALEDPPSYSAVRATLRLLAERGHVRHVKSGRRYVYAPTVDRGRAGRSALRSLLHTFFAGSVERAVASLLDVSARDLTAEEHARLARLVDEARPKGGGS
jgi:predicted transcriptional regulator